LVDEADLFVFSHTAAMGTLLAKKKTSVICFSATGTDYAANTIEGGVLKNLALVERTYWPAN